MRGASGTLGTLLLNSKELICSSWIIKFKTDIRNMHIAAADPRFIRKEDLTSDVLEQEREIARARALGEGKPEKVVDKIVEGRLQKFYEEVCLLEQPFVKEATLSVGQLVKTKIAKLGENISVARFVRFKVGDVAAVEAGAHSGSDGAGPQTA